MVTMNKPASQNTNWYQPVTDNWTAIETSLIDKSIVTAKGDLISATGASTPVRHGVGQDGQILVADSTQGDGLNWTGGTLDTTNYMDSLVLNKRFFSSASLLPGTKYYETAVDTAPTPDWDNTGVTPKSVGSFKRWEGVTGPQCLGWDLGGAKQRILMIFSAYQMCQANRLMFVSSTKPATGDLNGNGYAGGVSVSDGHGAIYRADSGTLTGLASTNYLWNPLGYMTHGSAMLFDNGNVRFFYRFGNFEWMEGTYKNDGTYKTLRYPGVRLLANGALALGAVSIWYDT
jgi:hypothetical protein